MQSVNQLINQSIELSVDRSIDSICLNEIKLRSQSIDRYVITYLEFCQRWQ